MPVETVRVSVAGAGVCYASKVTCCSCGTVMGEASVDVATHFAEAETAAYASSRSRAIDVAKKAGALIGEDDSCDACAECRLGVAG